MNKRIKELAEQADLLGEFTPTRTAGRYVGYINVGDIEKFAELIIRECANFLDENSGYDDAGNSWHPEPEDLLNYFGVKV